MTQPVVSPLPALSDPTRLQRLAACRVTDAGREPLFDEIVADAARLAGAPAAALGFLAADREWVKASHGWNATSLTLDYSFAAPLAGARDLVVVPDLAADPRFAAHPLVTGAPHLRFLAAAPLVDGEHFLGALTVLDRAPRALSREQVAALRQVAARAMAELRGRRQADELARLAASLEDAEERFRDFFERTTDLIMSIDADGRLLHANQAVLDALGMEREELVNRPLANIIEPVVRDDFRLAFAEVIASGEQKPIETTFVSSTGKRINVEGGVNPKVIDGRAVLARVMFRDITERINFESELGRAKDAALEAARLKTQFLSNVSHEIRTPMNGIVGMLDLLASTPLHEEQRDYATQARTSAENLLTIVNNILYVSNLEAGGLAASNVDFDLFRMLQRIAEVMKIAALAKDVDVTLDFDPRLPAVFRGNQSKLRQVVTNLMENAVKFTEQGRITLRAQLQTETETHRVVRFEVKDTGIGIAAEDRLLLFEKFSQIEAGSTRRFEGVGLGLSTARHLVETMGGLIDVESTPGVGSTFWFAISFAKDTAVRPIASSDLSFQGRRVLVIDGALTHRRVVRHYLETIWEMRVDAEEKASVGLAMLRKAAAAGDPYGVLLYDRSAEFDEVALAHEIRGDAAIAPTRLILMTGDGAPVNEERLREAGVQAYVAKPVGQAELFDAITIAMARDALPLARPLSGRWRAVQLPPPQTSPEQRRSVRVLLVEDNFLNMKLTMSQLTKLGYLADSVSNGKEAVDAIAGGDYDIIVMDCQMPVMDGYEATMEIRKRDAAERRRRRRIIAMTANALEGDREKCLAAGMDDYLAKPTKQNELEVALARYFAPLSS